MIRMKKGLKEKVISVPENLKRDVNEFIKNVLCSNFIHYFRTNIENMKHSYPEPKDDFYYNSISKKEDKIEQIQKRFNITKEYNFNKEFPYFKYMLYEIDMSDYVFKYGDISNYLKRIFVFITIEYSDKHNGYYSDTTNTIKLMGNHYVDFLNDYGFNGEYFAPAKEFEKNFDKVLDDFHDMLQKYYLLFEHEFIHAIQYEFFGDYINKSVDNEDLLTYTISDLEINPLIVSEYGRFLDFLKGREYNNDTIRSYIDFSRYFQTLRQNNTKLYRKMVSSFYDYIEKNIGSTRE